MINTISTVSAGGPAARATAQAAASYVPTAPVANSYNDFFISSRIRMDNQLDMAILEFRSSETGDVVRQYPTESQIRAFQRAAELEARETESRQRAQVEASLQQTRNTNTPEPSLNTAQVQSDNNNPAPSVQQQSASIVANTYAAAPSSGGASSASTDAATSSAQSVLV